MNKLTLACIAALMLSSCEGGTPVSVETEPNGYEIQTLFTKDGCTVYRFYDRRFHYFTNCRGETASTYNCGKNCTAPENIGGRK